MLTKQDIRRLLLYDEKTGEFSRLNSKKKIKVGTVTKYGYIQISLLGKCYLAHRLAWLYVYGEFPIELDHINGIRTDNKISNLREATRTQNQCNRRITSRNKSGVKGISWHKKAGKWQAFVGFKNKSYYLGLFTDLEEAKKILDLERDRLHQEFSNNID